MRVPGLHTSELPARSSDRARRPLLACTLVACAAVAFLAAGVLAVDPVRAAPPGSGSALRGASIALSALFGLSVLLIALLVLQAVTRRRYESALEGTIRRQGRLLQEISAISTMVELL